jgi:hypothetical protein
MDKAEEVIRSRAVSETANDYCSLYYDWDNEAERRAVIGNFKQGYYEGYKHAEKDLALTPEDVVVITTLYECGKVRGWTIEEVLRRFNEQRKK